MSVQCHAFFLSEISNLLTPGGIFFEFFLPRANEIVSQEAAYDMKVKLSVFFFYRSSSLPREKNKLLFIHFFTFY
jgi:hypothetical protein